MAEQELKETSYLSQFAVDIQGLPSPQKLLDQVTVNEVYMTESLLTPGLQTSIILQNKTEELGYKNPLDFKGKTLQLEATRPILAMILGKESDSKPLFSTKQTIYRMSKRELVSYKIEQYQLDCCDPSMLTDAETWVSKSWNCNTPSDVVNEMFSECLKVENPPDVEQSNFRRPYIAENIHPFQVITQQAEVAASFYETDPSFVHYMTYQDNNNEPKPTHHFRSIMSLAKRPRTLNNAIKKYIYSGKASRDTNHANPTDIMKFSFPCDFDLLSDKLNQIASSHFLNVGDNQLGYQGYAQDCGLNPYIRYTPNQEQQGCPVYDPSYMLKRKPRMGLLDQDKIALRMTIPFNPMLHPGDVITAEFRDIFNTSETGADSEVYFGTGDYLIVNITHNIKLGGLGLTTMDCVAQTVAAGATTGSIGSEVASQSDQLQRDYYSDPSNVWNVGN